MSTVPVEEERIKELLKEALLEILQEKHDILYDLVAEVVEDLALMNAIREGESTETVSKAKVLRILEGPD